jgi:hypothetical protein
LNRLAHLWVAINNQDALHKISSSTAFPLLSSSVINSGRRGLISHFVLYFLCSF